MTSNTQLLDQVQWNSSGLVPAIAQDSTSGDILMLAWMNREALALTLERGQAVYWSRSRQSLWHKGESSGHVQQLKEIRLDCDCDTVLMQVEQAGGIACHTGRRHCFMYKLENDEWRVCEPVLKQPSDIYGQDA
jgi:phosphoribosyl-AMP cyclohydrolase